MVLQKEILMTKEKEHREIPLLTTERHNIHRSRQKLNIINDDYWING